MANPQTPSAQDPEDRTVIDTSDVAKHVPHNPNATIFCVNNKNHSFVARGEEDVEYGRTVVDADMDGVDFRPATLSSNNTFEFRKKFAEGGFGEVWQGAQNSLGRTIAIKRLRDQIYAETRNDLTTQRFYEESFLREAIVTARLEHPNIVPIYDFALDKDGKPLLAMKLVNGKPWGDMIKADRKMGVDDFLLIHLPILISVCQAVAFAHSKGILHRDLKPSQVMVGEFNEVLLMDWGLALVYDEKLTSVEGGRGVGKVRLSTRESSGNPAGTIAFMAPEQTLESGDQLGPWTDIYLLGGMLYYLLTGFPPHHSPDSSAAFLHAKMGYIEPPQQLAPGKPIPPDLAELAMKALFPVKEDRLKTVHDLIFGMENFLVGANHRRTSRQLIQKAEEKFEEAGSSYSRIGESLSLVDQALGLWSSNPAGPPLKQNILHTFTELALKNNDLIMAKTQAEQMAESPEKSALTLKVAARIRKDKIQSIALRAFMVITIVALFGVSILSASLNDSRQRTLDAQEESDRKATETAEAKKRAEALVYFLVSDLTKELANLHRLDVLDQVATEAKAYYDQSKENAAQLSREDRINRAALYEIIGNIRQMQGRLTEAREAYTIAAEQFTLLSRENESDATMKKESLESEFHLAETLIMSQEFTVGSTQLAQTKIALSAIKQNTSWYNSLPADELASLQRLEARTQFLEAMVFFARGKMDTSLPLSQQALDLLRKRRSEGDSSFETAALLVEGLATRAMLERESGDLTKAGRTIQEAWDVLESVLKSTPRNPSISALEALILLESGIQDVEFGAAARAVSSLKRVDTISQGLTKQDSTNLRWLELNAKSKVWLGYALLLAGELGDAEKSLDQGLKIYESMLAVDSSDISRQAELSGALMIAALIRMENKKYEEALAALVEAETILKPLQENSPEFLLWPSLLAEVKLLEAKVGITTKQPKLTTDSLKETETILTELAQSTLPVKTVLQGEWNVLKARAAFQNNNTVEAIKALETAQAGLPKNLNNRQASKRLLEIQRAILQGTQKTDQMREIQQELESRLKLAPTQ